MSEINFVVTGVKREHGGGEIVPICIDLEPLTPKRFLDSWTAPYQIYSCVPNMSNKGMHL